MFPDVIVIVSGSSYSSQLSTPIAVKLNVRSLFLAYPLIQSYNHLVNH